MKETKNYKLQLPEQTDNIDVDVLDANFTELDRLIFEKVKEILEAVGKKADTASPTLTGTPKAPTPTSTDNSTRIATTAFVQGLVSGLASASSVSSLSSSVSSFSSALELKADKASPTFTGAPKAPTPNKSENSTRIATTAFVQSILSQDYGNVYVTDKLDVISAYGSEYINTDQFGTQVSHLLNSVKTTWGDAVHGNDYGTAYYSYDEEVPVYVKLYVSDGKIYWDEYYYDPGDGAIYIDSSNVFGHRGDDIISYSYTNQSAGGAELMSLRDAVIYLLQKVNK